MLTEEKRLPPRVASGARFLLCLGSTYDWLNEGTGSPLGQAGRPNRVPWEPSAPFTTANGDRPPPTAVRYSSLTPRAPEPLRQVPPIRQMLGPPRRLNHPAVQFLQPVPQHRSVVLLQHIRAQVYPVLRVHAQDPHIVRPVVDPAADLITSPGRRDRGPRQELTERPITWPRSRPGGPGTSIKGALRSRPGSGRNGPPPRRFMIP